MLRPLGQDDASALTVSGSEGFFFSEAIMARNPIVKALLDEMEDGGLPSIATVRKACPERCKDLSDEDVMRLAKTFYAFKRWVIMMREGVFAREREAMRPYKPVKRRSAKSGKSRKNVA